MTDANGKPVVSPTESKTTRTVRSFSHGGRQIPVISASSMEADRGSQVSGRSQGTSILQSRRAGAGNGESTCKRCVANALRHIDPSPPGIEPERLMGALVLGTAAEQLYPVGWPPLVTLW